MPIYEYACEKCGNEVDLLQKVSDPPPETCVKCGETGTMKKRVSRSSFVLKGGGWYSDLYGSAKKDVGTATTTTPAAGATTSSSGTPAAPSSTTTATPPSTASTPTSTGGSGGGSDKK